MCATIKKITAQSNRNRSLAAGLAFSTASEYLWSHTPLPFQPYDPVWSLGCNRSRHRMSV